MKVGQIRDSLDASAWMRHDLSGHTREEFVRANVADTLGVMILELEQLVIPARFRAEEERRQNEISYCKAVIDRWKAERVRLKLPISGDVLRPEVSQPPANLHGSRGEAGSVTFQERNVFSDADILALPCQTRIIQ